MIRSEGLGLGEVHGTDGSLSNISVGGWSLVLGGAYVPRRGCRVRRGKK